MLMALGCCLRPVLALPQHLLHLPLRCLPAAWATQTRTWILQDCQRQLRLVLRDQHLPLLRSAAACGKPWVLRLCADLLCGLRPLRLG
jgi:hypothetical protein